MNSIRKISIEMGIFIMIFGFSFLIPSFISVYSEDNNPYHNSINNFLYRIESSDEYLSAIIGIYATILSIGIPIAINIVADATSQYKLRLGNILIREREFRFQIFVIPVFLGYTIVLAFMNRDTGFPMLIVLLFILYSIYRFIRFMLLLLYIASNTRRYVFEKEREALNAI